MIAYIWAVILKALGLLRMWVWAPAGERENSQLEAIKFSCLSVMLRVPVLLFLLLSICVLLTVVCCVFAWVAVNIILL